MTAYAPSSPPIEPHSLRAQVAPPENRKSFRKKFNGRVKVFSDFPVVRGKIFDLSSSGSSILVDMPLPSGRKILKIQFDIFHKGKNHNLEIMAIPVYSVLVTGVGYKIGLQFGAIDDKNELVLSQLLEV